MKRAATNTAKATPFPSESIDVQARKMQRATRDGLLKPFLDHLDNPAQHQTEEARKIAKILYYLVETTDSEKIENAIMLYYTLERKSDPGVKELSVAS